MEPAPRTPPRVPRGDQNPPNLMEEREAAQEQVNAGNQPPQAVLFPPLEEVGNRLPVRQPTKRIPVNVVDTRHGGKRKSRKSKTRKNKRKSSKRSKKSK